MDLSDACFASLSRLFGSVSSALGSCHIVEHMRAQRPAFISSVCQTKHFY